MQTGNLPDKEFKITVIKMITEDGTMHEQSKTFNKEWKCKKVSKRNHRAEEFNN